MSTLLVGATGLLGPVICQTLADAGHPTRALVRATSDPAKRAALEQMGVALVEGDLKDPASLDAACAGARVVISTASSTLSRQSGDSIESVDRSGQLALVGAARRAGVERFVFVSFRHHPHIDFPLAAAKRAVEHALQTSGMACTILQASYFMEVWLSPALGFDPANGKVRVYGDGTRPISWISFADVARAAAHAVIDDVGRDTVIELGGPEALSPREVVRLFEAARGEPIAIDSVPVAALEQQLRNATDALQQSFAGLMLQYAEGDVAETATSRRLFPFAMTSVGDFVAAQRATV
jgi:NADH dehydrogenase